MRSLSFMRQLLSRTLLAPGRNGSSSSIAVAKHGKRAFSSLSTTVSYSRTPLRSAWTTTTSQTRSTVVITQTKATTGNVASHEEDDSVTAAAQSTTNTTPTTTTTTSSQEADSRLIITDACWKQILKLAAKKQVVPQDMFLRVYVDAGGCSGFEYKFEVETDADDIEEDDVIWQGPEGARVVVDEGSLGFIQGATLDYVVEMIKSAFTVRDNPQSESACGCGSSFAVKNFSANPAMD